MITEKTILNIELKIPYSFTTGKIVGTFLFNLKNGKISMVTCKKCGTSYFPPLDACESCMEDDFEWKEAPQKGEAILVVELPQEKYNLAYVKLPGVKGAAAVKAEKDVRRGDSVVLSLEDERKGSILDIILKKEESK